MAVALITGSNGLIGSEATRWFGAQGFDVVGIDNDMRARFFGEQASTLATRRRLEGECPFYQHRDMDIRDREALDRVFRQFGANIAVIVHTAAQPSHDWAARDPVTDFEVNATATLYLLEATRQHCPDAVFIFTSTNKVYGDTPNALPLVELDTRWELPDTHHYYGGIDETMSLDQSKHSLFGVSKLAADLLVQEYGRYFGMKTGIFRGGCLTGPAHAGTELHGFLSFLVKCAVSGQPYTVFGHKGKQVRDNIHSSDLVRAFWAFFQRPGIAKVYNLGGGRHSNCSMIEAIRLSEEISGRQLHWTYSEQHRSGDHIWWVSSVRQFQEDYPEWRYQYSLRDILLQIHEACV